MDIFSLPKQRNIQQQPFKYPLPREPQLSEDVIQLINQDIKERFEVTSNNFERYIKQKYAEMDYKINRCTFKCYGTADTYSKMKECKKQCTAVQRKLPKFIEENTSYMNQLLNNCLNQSKTLIQNEVFRCYDSYIHGFEVLKLRIEEESRFYQ